MCLFAVAVFSSSFLLFAVEPMIAKFLLPAFGGTAAVWSTCLVVFQVLLLGGYAYAHWLRRALSPKAQRWTHLTVLVLALAFLPPVPHVSPVDAASRPVWSLLSGLVTCVGAPFFALSATAPLLMEWFRQSNPGRSPDRLYAFSNAGSLLALICYPAILEPEFARSMQARLWAGGMVLFVGICAAAAWRYRIAPQPEPAAGGVTSPPGIHARQTVPGQAWLWVLLPACGSGLLLALTNQISQDVAPMPLLWVAPMAVYLLTFILCFEGPRSYQRGLFIPACFLSFVMLGWLLYEGYLHGFWVQVGGYLLVLFLGCMVCHGEVYRLRPPPEQLTAYYLAIAVGGAVGGCFVGLAAPALFNSLLETPLIATLVAGLATFILWRESGGSATESGETPSKRSRSGGHRRRSAGFPAGGLALGGTLSILAVLGGVVWDQRKGAICFARSFYGAYKVKEGPTLLLDRVDYPLAPGVARVLVSGQIYHGLQFVNPAAANVPTTYYCEEGGLGIAFQAMPEGTNRHIGVIGLGAGTLSAYGRAGDRIRFYELNPDVVRIARTQFSFLTNCPGEVEVVLGDGRLSLEREPAQGFDLLVLDAFSGDSIPVHLLTQEAMKIYERHLRPGGVMAFHVSNSHLDLEPVVRALAQKQGLPAVLVPARFQEPREGKMASVWMLLSANGEFLKRPVIQALADAARRRPLREPILWTDDYSSILPILH